MLVFETARSNKLYLATISTKLGLLQLTIYQFSFTLIVYRSSKLVKVSKISLDHFKCKQLRITAN